MCGIFCIISQIYQSPSNLYDYFHPFASNIKRRGPDCLKHKFIAYKDKSVILAASVLWLQGKTVTPQPVEENKCVLVYNGDVFSGSILDEDRTIHGDTILFFKRLQLAENKSSTLANIHGPYAFIYFDENDGKLYFGRDIYGRRSLLINKCQDKLILTSVAKRNAECDFMEVPSIGTFCLDINNYQLSILPWHYQNKNYHSKLKELEIFLNQTIVETYELCSIENKLFVEPTIDDLKLFNTARNFDYLLDNEEWRNNVINLQKLLEIAIEKRIKTQPVYCKNCLLNKNVCKHATTGVLFSGGVDCTVLALLASKYIDEERPIDLINVAFEKNGSFNTPDRETGLNSLKELKKLEPKRKWNFVQVNVPSEELNKERTEHVADLIYPLNTILDDDLGCALWFAARAKSDTYESPSRVLIVGMGADELFGGYRKHAAAFKEGWSKLHDILNEDWQNLPHRNLGRDDRVVSDHGRQLRTPYLDENLVEFVRNLHPWQKTWPSLADGFGEKVLLRSLAYKLKLENAAFLPKRALQFGSRIADPKRKAHQVSEQLNCTLIT